MKTKTKHDYNAILQMFCTDGDYTRFDLSEPFLQNDFSWGTNGHFIASVPADIYKAEKRDNVPDPSKIELAQDMTTYKIPVSVLQDEDLDEELRLYNKWLRQSYENFVHGDCSEMFEIESKFPPMCQIVKQYFSYGYISTIRNAFTQLGITEIIFQETDTDPATISPPAIFEGGHLKVLLMPLRVSLRNRKQLYQPEE